MTEQEQRERQLRAYENRDSILPRDVLYMTCSEADDEKVCFELPGGTLTVPREGAPIRAGDRVKICCVSQIVKANGYGLFVDYGFAASWTGQLITINGPDAQSLVRTVRPVKIQNRDVLLLREVLPTMQQICQTEKLWLWQRERMAKITADLSGMPRGGGGKGLDEALAALDSLEGEQKEQLGQYAALLRRAERILNGLQSRTLRSFCLMKYVMGLSDADVRRELNLTRRSFERVRRAILSAPDMAAVEWQEQYILAD